MTEKIYTNPHSIVPAELKPGDMIAIKIVAVIGQSGRDWAAYEGDINTDILGIALNGDKIPASAAMELFYAPTAAGLQYRR